MLYASSPDRWLLLPVFGPRWAIRARAAIRFSLDAFLAFILTFFNSVTAFAFTFAGCVSCGHKSDAVQIYRYVWIADMPDPDNFLFPLFASNAPANFTGFRNVQIDQMLIEARGVVDPVERAQKYQTIEKLVLKSYPILPLFYLSIDRVYQPTVQGVQLNALAAEHMPYHRIWLNHSNSRIN